MPLFLLALLATTALISVAAHAQGGAGGAGLGGAGGANSNFAAGEAGGNDTAYGGGGGGAGDTGGAGGAGDAAGGAGGASPGAAGAAGAHGANAGAGGGGGAHGLVDSSLPRGALTGGAGGAGGNATGAGGGGGGGGAGGAGLVFTPLGHAGTLFDSVAGGAGGAGGATLSGQGGQGGQGGAGLVFTSPDGVAIEIQANVTGGSGGAGGAGSGTPGPAGLGGSAIRGEGLALTLGATLSGGLSGDGATRANALELTGGSNLLAIGAGGAMVGGIALSGFAALDFAQTRDASLAGGISGLGSISKSGAGTLTLNAAGTYVAGTFVAAGTLVLGHAAALGSGLIGIGDATLRSAVDATLANDLRAGFGASATIAAATGTTLTLEGGLTLSANSTLTLGATGAAGGIVANVSNVDTTDIGTAALIIAAGSVTAGGFAFNDLIANAGNTTIRSGATLDLGGQLRTIANLQGSGTLTNTDLIRIREGNFAGAITGAGGSLEKVGGGTLTLTGTNTYTGTTEISGGTLRVGDGGTTGRLGTGAVINDGALIFARSNALTVSNTISGSGSVTQAGTGVLTLAAANTYAGGTQITAGTLALGNTGALGGGAVTLTNGALVSNVTGSLANAIELTAGAAGRIGAASGQALTLNGALTLRPSSSLTIGSGTATGTVVLDPGSINLFSPATLTLNVAGGTLRAGSLLLNQLTQGAASVTISAGGTLDFAGLIGTVGNLQGAGTLTGAQATQISSGNFAGVIAGAGGLDKVGSGTLTLTGANTYSGTTTISEGTLRIGAGGQLSGGSVTNNGAVVFARNDTLTLANAISGTGSLTQAGSGTLILTGSNTHAGLTTINAGGTIRIGDGGTSGQISGGSVLNNGALVVNRGNAVTLGNAISGTGSLTQAGAGTLTLTGANTYSGETTIQAGAALRVEGGGTLGSGRVINAGDVVLNRGGSLTIAGIVGGGTLTQAGGGTVTVSGGYDQAATAISAGTLRFTGGSGTVFNPGTITNDGALILDRANAETALAGVSGTGRLEIASGRVTLAGGTSSGGVLIAAGATLRAGLFADGGGSAASLGAAALVNHGTLQLGGLSAPVTNDISGAGQLTTGMNGRATLTGRNTYTGGTETAAGSVLTIGDGGTSGTLGSGAVRNSGSLIFNRTDTVTVASRIEGSGALTQAGSGTLILTGNNSGGGAWQVTQGVLQIGNGGTTGSIGAASIGLAAGTRLDFNRADTLTVTSLIEGAGEVRQTGSGTTILTRANTYSGATVISAGTLRIGAGGSLGAGAVSNSASLVFDTGGTLTQTGAISGTGRLEVASGTLVLRTASHTGGTAVAAGATLQVGDFNSPGSLAGAVLNNGTVRYGGGGPQILGLVATELSGSGRLRLAAQGIVIAANNSHTGGTIVEAAATVTVGTGGTTGSLGTGAIDMQAARLAFNRSDAVVLAQPITGEGRLQQMGGGTLILTGANSYGGQTWVTQGAVQLGDGGRSGSLGTSEVALSSGTRLLLNRSDVFTVANVVAGAGELRQIGTGTAILTGANSYSGGTVIGSGTLSVSADVNLGASSGGLTLAGGTLAVTEGFASLRHVNLGSGGGGIAVAAGVTLSLGGVVDGPGGLTLSGPGTLILSGANSYGGGTLVTAGTLSVASDGNLGAAGGGLTLQGATLAVSRSFASARGVTLLAGGGAFAPVAGAILTLEGVIGGPGDLAMQGAGTLWLNGLNSYSGVTSVNAGTLILGPGGGLSRAALSVAAGAVVDISRMAAPSLSVASLGGQGLVALGSRNLTITAGGTSFGGSLVDGGAGGSLTVTGGITTLTGASSYTGPTLVSGGMLVVNGTLGGTSGVVVSGGVLAGTGQVPGVLVEAGGSLSPGNSIGTINLGGTLTLAPGSTTVIEVQGGRADRINVAGQAVLGGTLRLVPLGGPYVFSAPYTLIRAAGVTGQFAVVSTGGSFGAGVTTRLTSTADALELRLTPAPLMAAGGRNPQAVAVALNAAVAAGADASPLFALYNLPAAAQPRGLSLLSGEVHVAGMRAAIGTSGQLLGLLLDPWRSEGEATGATRIWASGFGGGGRRGGDGATGSGAVTGGGGGVAAGAEIRLGAGLTAGFALAGAGTQASLSGGLGRAESNQIHGALYGRAEQGPWRVGAALTYGGADATTRRQVAYLGPGQLEGRYTSHGLAVRLEGGWAWQAGWGVTLTPGIAFQGGWFDTPGFTENAVGALAAAALGVSGRQAQSRLEIGLRADTPVGARLSAFGRIAWAAYLQRDAAVVARFTGLPGSDFSVSGARPDAQAALLSAGLEWRLAAAWSLTGRLDAELSAHTAFLGGTARLRYAF